LHEKEVCPGIARLEKSDPGPSEKVKFRLTCSFLARWPSFRFFYEATLGISSRFYFETTGYILGLFSEGQLALPGLPEPTGRSPGPSSAILSKERPRHRHSQLFSSEVRQIDTKFLIEI
jgi:hypothetical protein